MFKFIFFSLYNIYNIRNLNMNYTTKLESIESKITKLESIESKIINLEKTVERIESKLDRLLNEFKIIHTLEPQCRKMSEHIDFVENVYDKVKKPMHYVLNKISQIRNITDTNTDKNQILDK